MKIAVISDIHGNAVALRAVMRKIKTLGHDKVYCLGDFVGYYPEINEAIDLVRTKKILAVSGNHDFALANDSLLGSPDADWSLSWAKKVITAENLRYLSSLPKKLEIHVGSTRILLVHGSPWNPLKERIYPDAPLGKFRKLPYEIVAMGHTHWPFITATNGKLIINPGSVGQSRDGDKRASFLSIKTAKDKVNVKIERVDYNPARLIKKLDKLGFPSMLKDYLPRQAKVQNENQSRIKN